MGLWFEEVLLRQRQLDSWCREDRPPKFWLTGFYNPQGFLTSVRQEVTRAHKNEGWALDDVQLKSEVLKLEKQEVERAPAEGVYIFGLFIEGAGWDKTRQRLKDPLPKEPPRELPILFVTAIQGEDTRKVPPGMAKSKEKVMAKFDCPVYKYPKRNDVNWIFDVPLNCEDLEGMSAKHFWQVWEFFLKKKQQQPNYFTASRCLSVVLGGMKASVTRFGAFIILLALVTTSFKPSHPHPRVSHPPPQIFVEVLGFDNPVEKQCLTSAYEW